LTTNTIPWGKINFNDSNYSLTFSERISLNLKKIDNETIITFSVDDTITVNRFVTGNDHDLFIEPGLPDLPIIIKPMNTISVLPLNQMTVFIEVPGVIKILYGSQKKRNVLLEFSFHKLAKCFFGTTEEGEFTYSIGSPFNHRISDYEINNTNIYCPLVISNKSSENLEFEKMILRVPYLSIYQRQADLIANPVTITFKGHEQISQIAYKKSQAISTEGEYKLISEPRTEEDKNLLKRSFSFIKKNL